MFLWRSGCHCGPFSKRNDGSKARDWRGKRNPLQTELATAGLPNCSVASQKLQLADHYHASPDMAVSCAEIILRIQMTLVWHILPSSFLVLLLLGYQPSTDLTSKVLLHHLHYMCITRNEDSRTQRCTERTHIGLPPQKFKLKNSGDQVSCGSRGWTDCAEIHYSCSNSLESTCLPAKRLLSTLISCLPGI